jgi:glycosyltransferase involved in cell wall biosynthesis
MLSGVRTLLLCSRPPWPLTGGDRIRTWHLARRLATLGSVDVVATRRAHEHPAAIREGLPFVDRLELPLLNGSGVAWRSAVALLSGKSLQQAIYDSAPARGAVEATLAESPPDVVVAHLVRTVPWLGASHPPLVVDIQDALSAQYAASAGYRTGWRGLAMMLEASRIGPAEQRAVARASALSFISIPDQAAVPHPGVESVVASAALDLGRLAPTGVAPVPGRIGFLGNLRTASNRDMVTYFAKELFPAVRELVPGAEFHIIGHEAGADVRRLARLPGVVFVGPVNDQAPVLEACWLTVCPLRFGSGVQNKILESLALGTPVVTTPSAGEALSASGGDTPGPGSPAVIAELGSAFSEQVVALLQDRSRRNELGRAGRAWVTEVHRPERALAPLLSLVQRLAATNSSPLV